MSQAGQVADVVKRISWLAFASLAQRHGAVLPIEQTDVWDRFDRAMRDRKSWGRVVYLDAAGQPRALMSFTRMTVRGFAYLWGRHAPVWLGDKPTLEEEQALRDALIRAIRRWDRRIVFIRMHAAHPASDLRELLQTMTYDRTVILDIAGKNDEDILSSFKARGRRDVRKALRCEELSFHDETARAHEVFDELYDILIETGDRDGFRALAKETYLTMIDSLGPDHARLYVARHNGQGALVWSLVTVWGTSATRYYAGSSAMGRRLRAADALVYREACWLQAEGIERYDLMGVDSERVPELAGVREFKNKFVTDGPVDVPGAWDIAVRPRVYGALVHAMNIKHRAEQAVRTVVSRQQESAQG